MVSLTMDVFGSFYALRKLGSPKLSLECLLNSIRAGFPSWLPEIIFALGQQMAVILLFGYAGAYNSGLFYIAMTLAGFVVGIGSSMQSMMLPYLSGSEEREGAALRSLRISLALTLPIVGAILIFPDKLLSLLGENYSKAWPELMILMISNEISLIPACLTNLLYSRDMFGHILRVGFAVSIPRLLFYVILASLIGSIGISQ